MFHSIPQPMLERMAYLEKVNAEDQANGTKMLQRLRQIPPETGKFIALLAASAPEGQYVEIRTSAGYSTLWLALACRAIGKKITTFEILDEKAKLARETFRLTNVDDVVTFVHGDAREHNNKGNFLSHLAETHEEWQIRQADYALNLYIYFLSHKNSEQNQNKLDTAAEWIILVDRVRESMRLIFCINFFQIRHPF